MTHLLPVSQALGNLQNDGATLPCRMQGVRPD